MAVSVSTSMPHTGSLAFGIAVHFLLIGYVLANLINVSVKDISFQTLPCTFPDGPAKPHSISRLSKKTERIEKRTIPSA